ncbi:MAG: thioredoxin family protein [Legionella sp. 40-6]|nr:MAG: thioredoxin family protein [Legionella sp. 40-6]
MAVLSNMFPLGSAAPDFTLRDTRTDELISLKKSPAARATVIMFLCNHCPYVKYVQAKIVELANRYQPQGVRFLAISANDVAQYPEDGPEQMRMEAEQAHYPFPYLYDETQEVAKAYQAACTPDFYIFDQELLCVYRGCLDDSTPKNNQPLTGAHLEHALESILAGTTVATEQKPSMGCGIKWKQN